MVTRIAFTAYARDTMRIISNPRIRGIIDTRLGPEYRKQFKPWLARIIHEGAVNAKAARWWQKVLKQARINMTIAAMGFRFSTGIAQTLGLTGFESYTIQGLDESLKPRQRLTVVAKGKDGEKRFEVLARIDTPEEMSYYRHGGILPYVLRQLVGGRA